ncbi:MAG: creatininase family protein [Candidatus Coatesbacteria bacterium]|nr:MAG: creatininase family protein [Candidatus Coatesbacteria bacterium]
MAESGLHLKNLNWRDFGKTVPEKTDTVFLPVGTIEAHGVVPLGTDIFIPEYLCDELAPRFDGIIAPAVNYGVTRTLIAYPGSHTVTSATFEAYLTEILTGFGQSGFRKAVVMNGHGGHIGELKSAARAAYDETGLFSLVLHWWDMVPDAAKEVYGAEGGHAAAEETAGILAVYPELVRTEYMEETAAYVRGPGVSPYPVPASILVESDESALPDPDVAKAKEYMKRVTEVCAETIKTVFDGWKKELGR